MATRIAQQSKMLVVLIIAVIVLAILPDLVHFLNVQHVPETVRFFPPRSRLVRIITLASAMALFVVCAVIVLGRAQDRRISGVIVLLLGLVVPYIISPAGLGTESILRIGLAAAVILAVWGIAAPVDVLKWVAVSGSMLGAYTVIGGLVAPTLMNYHTASAKAIILDWQLVGPFEHSNALGIYCVLSLAMCPLIKSTPWRLLNCSILCVAITASASRTALIAAGVLALWWIISWALPKWGRPAGTALVTACAAAVVVIPFLDWDPHAFTGREQIWATSLIAWKESPFLGLGVDWFATTARSMPYFNKWADLRSGLDVFIPSQGHNLVVDTLVRSGLVGIGLVALILLAAIRSARTLEVRAHQVACFGYLTAFLVASCTENIWILLPNMELFPVVGLVFAVLVAGSRGTICRHTRRRSRRIFERAASRSIRFGHAPST